VKFYKVGNGLKGNGFAILQPLPVTSTRYLKNPLPVTKYQTVTRYQSNGGTAEHYLLSLITHVMGMGIWEWD
jgi:hypothetical protein